MEKSEMWEWVIILLCVVGWWPRIFLNYDPLWYHLLIYYVAPIVLIVIAVRRYRRMKAGLDYSEHMLSGGSPNRDPKQR
jgi:hypothetical protein